MKKSFILSVTIMVLLAACSAQAKPLIPKAEIAFGGNDVSNINNTETVILGGGCFWCVQAAYELLPGIITTVAGYAGGSAANPSYEQVCAGGTGYIEVVKIDFDPQLVSLEQILDLFWKIHDPTSLDRQGADAGYQYHSIIMWTSEDQHQRSENVIKQIQARYARPILTELRAAPRFWPAEDYHQDYFNKNPSAGYCQAVIAPKLLHAGLIK